MKQFRENFEPIRSGLKKGREYLLLYRSKPLAVISPYEEDKELDQKIKREVRQSEKQVNKLNEEKTNKEPIIDPVQKPPLSPAPEKPTDSLHKFGLKKALMP